MGPLSAKSTEIIYDKTFQEVTGIDPSLDFSEILKHREEVIIKPSLEKHLRDAIVLFDSSLAVFQSVFEIFKYATEKDNENITFLVLSSKIFSLMLGMRKLLYSGSADSYKCLLRPLLESYDTFYTSLVNSDFSKEYGDITALYDNNEFWYKKGKGNKIKKFIHELYRNLGADNDFIKAFDDRRDHQQRYLSESLHSSFNASFSTYLTPTLDGDLRHMYGDVTVAFPNLLLDTIDEASHFHYILHTVCENESLLNLSFITYFKENKLYNYRCDKFAHLYQDYRPALAELQEETTAVLRQAYEDSVFNLTE